MELHMNTMNMKKLAKYFKLLSDGNRLDILRAIGKKERSVTEIINITGLSQTLVSFHLRALREAQMVTARRQGPFVYYSIAHHGMIDLLGDFYSLFVIEKNIASASADINQRKQG